MRKHLCMNLILCLTVLYGCGIAQETHSLSKEMLSGQIKKEITIVNPIQELRGSETVSLEWNKIKLEWNKIKSKDIAGLTKDNVAIYELKSDRLLVTQIVGDEKNANVLFQTDFAPGEKKYFWIMKQPEGIARPQAPYTTFCRFIPERKDDFGWENDKAAYRIYGPALEYETITSGIDAWGKCVPYPVIDKFIKAYTEEKISYHDGHSDTEGGDFYKVGNTLGCGGMAPFVDGKVCLPRNFVDWKIIDNGPIRSTFELTYKSWKAGSYTVSEVKRISIDLGSNMNRIECLYTSDNTDTLPLAAGIVLRETSDQTWNADEAIAYWLPTDFIDTMFGCGVVFDNNYKTKLVKADGHLLLTLSQKVNKPVVYYAGSCWDKNAEFSSYDKWQDYLKNFKHRIDNPVDVSFAAE